MFPLALDWEAVLLEQQNLIIRKKDINTPDTENTHSGCKLMFSVIPKNNKKYFFTCPINKKVFTSYLIVYMFGADQV